MVKVFSISQGQPDSEELPNSDAVRRAVLLGEFRSRTRKIVNKRSLQYDLLPAAAVIIDFFQLALANVAVVTWHGALGDIFRDMRNLVFVELPLPSVAIAITLYIVILALLIASAVYVYVPSQVVIRRLGHGTLIAIRGIFIATQTMLFMPVTQYLLRTLTCESNIVQYALKCGSAAHVTFAIMSGILVPLNLALLLAWNRNRFTPLELAKHKAAFAMSLRNANFTPISVGVKLLVVVPMVLLAPVVASWVIAMLLLALTLSLLVYLAWGEPYYHALTTIRIAALMSIAVWTNLVALIISADESLADTTVALIWLVGCILVPLLTHKLVELKMRHSQNRRVQDALSGQSGRSASNISRTDLGQHATWADDAVADLSYLLVGATESMWATLGQYMSNADLRGVLLFANNGLTPERLRMILHALLDNSTLTNVQALDFSGNRQAFKLKTESRSLQRLLQTCRNSLRFLRLDGCSLSESAVRDIAAGLENSDIEELHLSNCDLTHAKLCLLLPVLKTCHSLNALVLSQNNKLGVEGGRVIADNVYDLASLRRLDLSWCSLRSAGCMAVLEALNRPLALVLTANRVPRASKAAIATAVAARKGLDVEAAEPTLEEVLQGKTIFEAVGGHDALHAVVETFYMRLVTDRNLCKYFLSISMGKMRWLQQAFLTWQLGGPNEYTGTDMRSAHAHLGISDDDYDATVEHLVAAVLYHAPECPKSILLALAKLAESLRDDIVSHHFTVDGDRLDLGNLVENSTEQCRSEDCISVGQLDHEDMPDPGSMGSGAAAGASVVDVTAPGNSHADVPMQASLASAGAGDLEETSLP